MHSNSGINDHGIKDIFLIEDLDVSNNSNITNINHLQNIKILHARGDNCGINDHGISNLFLIEYLFVSDNPYVTNINHFKNLKLLYAEGNSSINNEGIKYLFSLTLKQLSVSKNTKISKKCIANLI